MIRCSIIYYAAPISFNVALIYYMSEGRRCLLRWLQPEHTDSKTEPCIKSFET